MRVAVPPWRDTADRGKSGDHEKRRFKALPEPCLLLAELKARPPMPRRRRWLRPAGGVGRCPNRGLIADGERAFQLFELFRPLGAVYCLPAPLHLEVGRLRRRV